ncbi:hypothetical protein GOODEAATRI_017820 [Goodea atripinnis]|uniref:Neurofibromin n=1 Tax=Goodea atripinnis TaxID=208336 RepID=A0ABV0PEX5_9TELE
MLSLAKFNLNHHVFLRKQMLPFSPMKVKLCLSDGTRMQFHAVDPRDDILGFLETLISILQSAFEVNLHRQLDLDMLAVVMNVLHLLTFFPYNGIDFKIF